MIQLHYTNMIPTAALSASGRWVEADSFLSGRFTTSPFYELSVIINDPDRFCKYFLANYELPALLSSKHEKLCPQAQLLILYVRSMQFIV